MMIALVIAVLFACDRDVAGRAGGLDAGAVHVGRHAARGDVAGKNVRALVVGGFVPPEAAGAIVELAVIVALPVAMMLTGPPVATTEEPPVLVP